MKVDLEELLKDVEKPARYLGGEWNEIKKNPKQVKARIALVFPELYEIGMSYLGQKILYSILNNCPSFLAERVFAPWIDFEEKLRSRNIPLYSLENKIPLDQFDVLGFSLLYELNYSNILTILELGHIPLFSSERDLEYPLVIAGGPAAFNPEPVADIFDLFLIGDGEEAVIEIVEKYMSLKKEMKEKGVVLKEMAKIKGVYVPSFYTPYKNPNSNLLCVKPEHDVPAKVEKRVLFSFSEAPFPENILVPNTKVIFDRVALEVERGCSQKCRFCQASSIYFPPRVKSPSFVIRKALKSLRSTGYEDVSLSSLSISDYPYLDKTVEILMEKLEKQKVSLSLSSMRPKGLSSEITENIMKVRKTGFTLVPEAGTERLRRVINKKLTDEELRKASQNAFSHGWRLIKLYFMIGLPTERDEDLEGIVSLVEEIVKIGYKTLKTAPHINLSVASFIPKPHTPFQWIKMEDENVLIEKYKFLKSRLRKYPFVRFKKHPPKNSILEAIFSRGDRQLSRVLLSSWKKGARFDSWTDCFKFSAWEEAFLSENIDYGLYLGPLEKKEILPWEHIDTGIKKSHLLKEWDKAIKEERTLSCRDSKCGLCEGCVYSTSLEREFPEKIKISGGDFTFFGKITPEELRYRVFYSKLNAARFISQIDLNNIIQRSFRRAGISVVHSGGFHPKMLISYPPALPLGMEGKAECLDFRSQYHFEEKKFISRMNKYVPSGIKFLSLRSLENFEPSLSKGIKTLAYSIDLKNQEVSEALEAIRKENSASSSDHFEIIERLIDDFLANNKNEYIEDIFLDRKSDKLFISLMHSPQKSIRTQDIVEDLFQMKNPVFAMAREKILFSDQVKRDAYESLK